MRFNMAIVMLIVLVGCGESSPVSSVSRAGGTNSHHAGENCMQCHSQGGGADSWFQAAGTLITKQGDTITSGTVTIHFQDGSPPVSLEVDSLGSFFTTEELGLPTPIAPIVKDNTTGDAAQMPFTTVSGSCNFCHTDSNRFHLSTM